VIASSEGSGVHLDEESVILFISELKPHGLGEPLKDLPRNNRRTLNVNLRSGTQLSVRDVSGAVN